MSELFILFEHATGYSIFSVKEFEEIAGFIKQVERSAVEFAKFKKLVKLISFKPFKNGQNALENINSISEGVLHEDLALFLKTNLPKPKKVKFILGVSDQKVAAAIQETLGYSCQHTEVVPEIIRGIRLHWQKLIDGLTPQAIEASESSLGRSYSRAKVKFNVNRADNMIIQSIALLDQLDKDINTFAMRLREWYSYHYPELAKIVCDNYKYARVAKLIGNRKELGDEEDLQAKLEEILFDSDQAEQIITAAKSSMGMDISEIDLINILMFTNKVINLTDYRKQLFNYLGSRMQNIAPNLSTLIGEQVGARLISKAGSLINLAKCPASTVQILGAEKALFRALKTRGNTPKYGLIYNSTFISRAAMKTKGRISRFLANKCSIASRIDCFNDTPTEIFGEKLKQQVEDRLTFYEKGEKPKKNIDVMKEAIDELKRKTVDHEMANGDEPPAKKLKKDKKKKQKKVKKEPKSDEE